jgi:hypothetical protein
MNLSDAITSVESAASVYSAASTTTENDQGNADAIQAKLDTAKDLVASDKQAQNAAAITFNGALDDLIATATTAKITIAQ